MGDDIDGIAWRELFCPLPVVESRFVLLHHTFQISPCCVGHSRIGMLFNSLVQLVKRILMVALLLQHNSQRQTALEVTGEHDQQIIQIIACQVETAQVGVGICTIEQCCRIAWLML